VGGIGVADKEFRAHIEEALEDPLARFIGLGDYTDSVSPSNQATLDAAFARGELYDTVGRMLESAAGAHKDEFLRLVAGTEGRWDALLRGHHTYKYGVKQENGGTLLRNTDMDIAEAVGAPYLGGTSKDLGMAMLSYVFPGKKKGNVLRVFVWHGQGGGQSFASPLNQLERMARQHPAHIYIVAHHHKLVAGRYVRLNQDINATTKLRATDSAIVAAGSWLRGFMPDDVTYAEDAGYAPLAIGAPSISARTRGDGTFRVRVTI
jgi:hypothetical protein